MGTTMHAHIEVKKNGRWFHFAAPIVPQNYFFFAVVNGEGLEYFRPSVREIIHPIASINELPNDMSEVTEFCYNQDKESFHVHGEGVLLAPDLRGLQYHLWDANEYDPKGKWDIDEVFFRTYINGNSIILHQGWDDVRVIFWYDH